VNTGDFIFVTGGTGFVGREIVRQLVEAGHRVKVLARDAKKAREMLSFAGDQIEFAEGDILQPDSLESSIHGAAAVIHSVGIIVETRQATFEQIHDDGVKNVVEAARKAGVKRFILISAQGTRATARSRYHLSKLGGEGHVRTQHLDWTVLRPSIIYGKDDHLVPWFRWMFTWPMDFLNVYTIPIFGDGSRRIQPVRVEEVAMAAVRSLSHASAVGQIIVMVGPEPIAWKDFLAAIARECGHETVFEPLPVRTLGRSILWALLPTIPFFVLILAWKNVLALPWILLGAAFWVACLALAVSWTQMIIYGVPLPLLNGLGYLADFVLPRQWRFSEQLRMMDEDNEGDPTLAVTLFKYIPVTFSDGLAKIMRP
jgi:NADH dehydrogenase